MGWPTLEIGQPAYKLFIEYMYMYVYTIYIYIYIYINLGGPELSEENI